MSCERIPDPNDVVISFINESHSPDRKYHLLTQRQAVEFWVRMAEPLKATAMIRPAEPDDYNEIIEGRSALSRGQRP